MTLSIHINFNGDCEAAFNEYTRIFAATLGTCLKVSDSPMAEHAPLHWQEKIVHANLNIDGVEIAGADIMPEQYLPSTGFCLLISCKNAQEFDERFLALAQGGTIQIAPQATFFSTRYGIVTDRFGVPWKLNCNS